MNKKIKFKGPSGFMAESILSLPRITLPMFIRSLNNLHHSQIKLPKTFNLGKNETDKVNY